MGTASWPGSASAGPSWWEASCPGGVEPSSAICWARGAGGLVTRPSFLSTGFGASWGPDLGPSGESRRGTQNRGGAGPGPAVGGGQPWSGGYSHSVSKGREEPGGLPWRRAPARGCAGQQPPPPPPSPLFTSHRSLLPWRLQPGAAPPQTVRGQQAWQKLAGPRLGVGTRA